MSTKPTKKDFLKELSDLIMIADEMTKVMELVPAIETDYNLDVKSKSCTNVYLQKCISELQAEIKDVAEEIDWDKDRFSDVVLERLKMVKVKVPDLSDTSDTKNETDEQGKQEEKEAPPVDKPIEKTESKKKKASSSNQPKSQHGYRLNTQAGRIDEAIDGKTTIEELATIAGVTKSRVNSHLGGLRTVKKLTVTIDKETKAVIVE